MRRLNMAGLLAAALGMTGCFDSDTVVHVDVIGQVEGIFQLVVDISAGGLATKLYVPMAPQAFTLPNSFNVQMDSSRQGELILDITANDQNGVKIASGTGNLLIDVGHLNPMTIELTAVSPPPGGGMPDAGGADAGGADGGVDAGLDAAPELGGDDTGSVDGGVAPETADDDAAVDDGGADVASDDTGP